MQEMIPFPKWTTPQDIRTQVLRWWEKGDLLRESDFPKRLTVKTPTAKELRDHFDAVRIWSQLLRDLPHVRVEMREFNHQVFGRNSLPDGVWVDDVASAIAFIGKQKEAKRFRQLFELTDKNQPSLLSWLLKRPLRALELANEWDKLLAVVHWLQTHPRPGIYLRQMDIPGVHSKFVETHRGTLSELLDLALAPEAIDSNASGTTLFNRRYGFLDKPERIRFRWLDPDCARFPAVANADLTLDAPHFAKLNPLVTQVFITENEVNFLAFPSVKNALIIFGAGYGFTALAEADWLHRCQIYYWGDIDTHGFAILDELRCHFPHVQSFLMDSATLLANQAMWGEEKTPINRELARLTRIEQMLYNDLRDQRIGKNIRLEQERIGFQSVFDQVSQKLTPACIFFPKSIRPPAGR